MASAVGAFMRTFGIDEPMGCYDDLEHADAFVLWGANMAEMHPILWSRLTDTRPHRRARRGGTCSRRSRTATSSSPTTAWCSRPRPIWRSSTTSPTTSSKTGAVNEDFVGKHVNFTKTANRHRLRPAPRASVGEKEAKPARAVARPRSASRNMPRRRSSPSTRSRRPARSPACRPAKLEALAELYADPNKVVVLLDHGLQPAHPRHLGQQPALQRPSADRQDLRARQRSVLADRPALGLRHRARGRHLRPSPAGRPGGDEKGPPGVFREDLEAARGHHPAQARLPRRVAEPHAQGRQAQRLLGHVQQQHAGRAQHERGDLSGLPQPGQLHRRPTPIRR